MSWINIAQKIGSKTTLQVINVLNNANVNSDKIDDFIGTGNDGYLSDKQVFDGLVAFVKKNKSDDGDPLPDNWLMDDFHEWQKQQSNKPSLEGNSDLKKMQELGLMPTAAEWQALADAKIAKEINEALAKTGFNKSKTTQSTQTTPQKNTTSYFESSSHCFDPSDYDFSI